MPLRKGSSKKVISKNISELSNSKTKAGKSRTHAQNVAIALNMANKQKGSSMAKKTAKKKVTPKKK